MIGGHVCFSLHRKMQQGQNMFAIKQMMDELS